MIVTEYGAAHLRGCPLRERARRLIAIAHPDHRESLLRALHEHGGQAPKLAAPRRRMNHIPHQQQRIPVSEEVSLEAVGDDVFEIRLQRPERMNALGVATCAALKQAMSDAARKRARVVLLCGSGRAFCAGADLKERKGMDLAARLAHNAAIRAAIDAVASARFVTIAVLNGVALGGGLELALGCDLRFAAAGVTLGLTGEPGGRLPGSGRHATVAASHRREPGAAHDAERRARDQRIRARHRTRQRSAAPDELEARTHAFAKTLAGGSAPALAAIKRLVYEGIELPLAAGLQVERAALPEILGSKDYSEGLAAFAERRPPRFMEVVQ